MGLKDIKATLKEARAAINVKDYNNSIKLCKVGCSLASETKDYKSFK